MARNANHPGAPVHPGEMREEFMVPLGFSANALALALRVPSTRISEIVAEHRRRYRLSAGEMLRNVGAVLDEAAE